MFEIYKSETIQVLFLKVSTSSKLCTHPKNVGNTIIIMCSGTPNAYDISQNSKRLYGNLHVLITLSVPMKVIQKRVVRTKFDIYVFIYRMLCCQIFRYFIVQFLSIRNGNFLYCFLYLYLIK